jgi:hypothetical protein
MTKVYKQRGEMQLHRLARRLDFTCQRCKGAKAAKLVAIVAGDWSKIICNGCYGELASQAPPADPSALAPAPGAERARAIEVPDSIADKRYRLGSEASEAKELADELRTDLRAFAVLLRRRAEGGALTQPQRIAVDTLALAPVGIGAVRCAEVLVDGELEIASVYGEPRKDSLRSARSALSARSRALIKERRRHHVRHSEKAAGTARIPDHLDALVMRRISGKDFDAALRLAAIEERRSPTVVDVPKENLWGWLEATRLDQTVKQGELSLDVEKIRKFDDERFLDMVTADARDGRFREVLTHGALVERWAAKLKVVEAELRATREAAHKFLVNLPESSRSESAANRYRAHVRAYAHVSAQSLIAELALMELGIHVAGICRMPAYQRLRSRLLERAAAEFARKKPDLARAVQAACAEHRATCALAKAGKSCAKCVGDISPKVNQPPVSVINATELFVCKAVSREVPEEVPHLVAVTAAAFDPSSGRFGYAWLTEEGELRTGTERALNVHDSEVQGICRTALDLSTDKCHVQVVSRSSRAVNVVREVLQLGLVPESLDFPVADHTRLLLAEVIGHGRQIAFVSHDRCSGHHRGSGAAARLANLASQAGHGRESRAVVQAVADRISQEFGWAVGPRLTAPAEEEDHAWWLKERPSRAELAWRAALYRMHLQGGWCVLPEGRALPDEDRRRLQLRLEHRGPGQARGAVTQTVSLRRRGGQWEISGIEWPTDLLPGTLVDFTWQWGTPFVEARTALLPKPERVGDLEFRHRYDLQVVTRETAPGSDQDREVPDLSDASWVLRTLRKLGYLSVDGEAILAEEALVRNCLELGLPPHRAEGIGPAVEQHLRAGRLQRVNGSVDYDGRPWFPPRPGHVRTPLLRYVPQVRTLTTPRNTPEEWRRHRGGHWVTGFVRRLPPGARASDEQVEAHREAIRAHELVNRDLPDGFTYVRRHRRAR